MLNDYDNRVILTWLKQGQEAFPVIKKKSVKPKFTAYPDYGKSIVTRTKQDPVASGVKRGLTVGAISAILTALATRLATKEGPGQVGKVLTGAGIGGLAGFVPGYISGSEEAKSDYTKLLFLRRLGIRSLGELGTSEDMPEVSKLVLKTQGLI